MKEQCISQLDCLIKIEDVSGYQVDNLQWLIWLKFKKNGFSWTVIIYLAFGETILSFSACGWFPSVKALKHTSKLCAHNVNLVIISCMEDCHYDNIQCSQWWECFTIEDFSGSTFHSSYNCASLLPAIWKWPWFNINTSYQYRKSHCGDNGQS